MGFFLFMYYCGIFTASVTGLKTILGLPLTPTEVRFTVNKTSNDPWLSSGEATVTAQEAHTTYFDVVPSGETLSDTTKCLTHYERQSGALVKVLSFAFVSFGPGRFKINIDTANPNIQIFVEVWG